MILARIHLKNACFQLKPTMSPLRRPNCSREGGRQGSYASQVALGRNSGSSCWVVGGGKSDQDRTVVMALPRPGSPGLRTAVATGRQRSILIHVRIFDPPLRPAVRVLPKCDDLLSTTPRTRRRCSDLRVMVVIVSRRRPSQ
jgi:hypothetical protein